MGYIDGLPPAHNLQQQDPKAKNISLDAQILRSHITRIEVAECAGRGSGSAGGREGGGGVFEAEGEAKVCEAGVEVAVDEYVCRLDVAVYDRRSGGVESEEALCRLEGEAEAAGPAGRPWIRVEVIVESAVRHELDDEQPLPLLLMLSEADEIDEARAADLGEDVDLVLDLVDGGEDGARGGALHGDDGGTVAVKGGAVDGPVAAAAQEGGAGEIPGGGF